MQKESIYLEVDEQIQLILPAKSSSDGEISVFKMKKVRMVFYSVPYFFYCKRVSVYFLYFSSKVRSSRQEVFCKKRVPRNLAKITGKHLRRRSQACNFIKKETLAQVFSCEFCEISNNTYCYRTPLMAASVKCV